MTRDEKCRKVAEWLGVPCQMCLAHANGHPSRMCGTYSVPDFYTDEAASAMLLEAMPQVVLRNYGHGPYGGWVCLLNSIVSDSEAIHYPVRLTAIAEAFLKWIESEGR